MTVCFSSFAFPGYHCCGESLANGREYRTHKDRVHVRKPETSCRHCFAKFRCRLNLYQHERIVHHVKASSPKCRCEMCFVPPRSAVSPVFEQYNPETALITKEITDES